MSNCSSRRAGTSQLTHIDIIELGMPFTDPIADGPVIQTANTVRGLIRHTTPETPSDIVSIASPQERRYNYRCPPNDP
jgi:tryptophan synthase alpha subunit